MDSREKRIWSKEIPTPKNVLDCGTASRHVVDRVSRAQESGQAKDAGLQMILGVR